MGWGEKAIEVRSVENGLLDGVFMHKRAQTFRFLCERNEKVFRHIYFRGNKFLTPGNFWCELKSCKNNRAVRRHKN